MTRYASCLVVVAGRKERVATKGDCRACLPGHRRCCPPAASPAVISARKFEALVLQGTPLHQQTIDGQVFLGDRTVSALKCSDCIFRGPFLANDSVSARSTSRAPESRQGFDLSRCRIRWEAIFSACLSQEAVRTLPEANFQGAADFQLSIFSVMSSSQRRTSLEQGR